MYYVQFKDKSRKDITGVFLAPQPAEFFPFQGAVEDDDPRLAAVSELIGVMSMSGGNNAPVSE